MKRAALLLWLTACGGDGLDAPAIDTVDGVVIVRNEGPSAWRDSSGWRLAEEAAIALTIPGDTIGMPTSIAVLDDGAIVVATRDPLRVLLYDAEGRYERTIAAEGDAPDSIRRAFLGVNGDTIVVQDSKAERLTWYHRDGRVLRTHRSVCCIERSTLALDRYNRAWLDHTALEEDARIRFAPDGVRDTVMLPPTRIGRKMWTIEWWEAGVHTIHHATPPLQTWRIALIRRDALVFAGHADSLSFALLRDGRDTVRRFSLPHVPQHVGDADRRRLMRDVLMRFTSGGQRRLKREPSLDDVPTTAPPVSALILDAADHLWAGRYGPAFTTDRFDVFDPDGRYLGTVPMPDPPIAGSLLAAGRDRWVAIEEGLDRNPRIRRWRVVRPTRP